MVEDISAQARLAIEVTSMGALLAVVLTLMDVGLNLFTYFEGDLINAYQNVTHVTVNSLRAERFVTSANMYKIVATLSNEVGAVNITRLDGTTKTLQPEAASSGDSFEYLMKDPTTKYSIEVIKLNGMYSFKLKEVN